MSSPTEQRFTISFNEELTQEKGITIFIEAIRIAQTKDIFSVEEKELLSKCISKFVKS